MKHAIIGTGGMAAQHARKFKEIEGVELVAACDIDETKAKEFCQAHSIPAAFTDAAEMLAKTSIDSVSVVTPDRFHAPVSLQAIAAGKHVLCEKPLATSCADALQMAEAAQKAGVINMVNFSYRDSSAIQMATEWVQAGKIGTVRHVEACYLQSWLTNKTWGDWTKKHALLWRLSSKHGSKGTLGDIGVHILDFATLPAGPLAELYCTLKTLEKPIGDHFEDYVFDANDTMMMNVEFANGATGVITATRWATGYVNRVALTIHGDRGAIRLDLDKSYQMMDYCELDDQGFTTPWQSVYTGVTPNIYQRFATSVETGVNDAPDFARGAEIQRYLDSGEESAAEKKVIALSS